MADARAVLRRHQRGRRGPGADPVLDRTDLVRYAGASGDYNPMHHDEVKAKAAGQPSVFGHGMFSMGLLGTAITDYVGVGNVRRYQVRFAKQTWPGREADDQDRGHRQADRRAATTWSTSTCALVNDDGEEKVVGEATAAVPSRA